MDICLQPVGRKTCGHGWREDVDKGGLLPPLNFPPQVPEAWGAHAQGRQASAAQGDAPSSAPSGDSERKPWAPGAEGAAAWFLGRGSPGDGETHIHTAVGEKAPFTIMFNGSTLRPTIYLAILPYHQTFKWLPLCYYQSGWDKRPQADLGLSSDSSSGAHFCGVLCCPPPLHPDSSSRRRGFSSPSLELPSPQSLFSLSFYPSWSSQLAMTLCKNLQWLPTYRLLDKSHTP